MTILGLVFLVMCSVLSVLCVVLCSQCSLCCAVFSVFSVLCCVLSVLCVVLCPQCSLCCAVFPVLSVFSVLSVENVFTSSIQIVANGHCEKCFYNVRARHNIKDSTLSPKCQNDDFFHK